MSCLRCHRDVASDASYCPACGAPQRGESGPAWASRRLVRIKAEQKLAGVCAGIADYLDVDVTLVRVLWLALSIVPGAVIGGILAYLLAWIVMPEGQASRAASGRRLDGSVDKTCSDLQLSSCDARRARWKNATVDRRFRYRRSSEA